VDVTVDVIPHVVFFIPEEELKSKPEMTKVLVLLSRNNQQDATLY
jgi:hypothetical protein